MTRSSGSAKEALGALSEQKTQLLNLLLEEKGKQTQEIRPYPRVCSSEGVVFPTSRAQQRLWFIDQLVDGRAGYQVPVAMRLRGILDQKSIKLTLEALVQRHEALRTVFVTEEGTPRQKIVADGRFPLEVIDLSAYEDAEREVQVRSHQVEETHRKFNLSEGPLIRGRLLRLQADEHVLLVTMHHIIADGWSKGVLLQEFGELYRAYREGRDDPLKPLPIQYADYAQWEPQWLQAGTVNKQLSYWRARLGGATPQLDLPTDRSRPAVQSYRGGNVPVALNAELTARLRVLAQRHDMTLFMVLCAGWAILLSRLSGQEDVMIGTPIANRQRPELESLIGVFVNTLVLRVGVQGELSLKKFFEQVKELILGAYDNQDVLFEQIVETLQPERSLSRNPLFQVMFVLHNAPNRELRLPGIAVTREEVVDEPVICDLVLALEEQGSEIAGSLNYATDIFDRGSVERWGDCFTVLLEGMTAEAQLRIAELPILSETERNHVIELFNASRAAYPKNKLIHQMFEEQVERTPKAVAAVYEGQALTYVELNERANRLAWYLRGKGIGPDQLVGICVERSLDMVVGLLGILKAGGAYVPLDPAYPPERLQYMLEDAAPKALLIQERLRERLPQTTGEVIALDTDWEKISQKGSQNLDLKALGLSCDQLAYVIYTSGSTGQPKGVAIEHRNTVNLICWARQAMDRNVFNQMLQSTSLNFDLSVYECFVPLSTGGSIRVVQNALTLRKEPGGVTLINTVPSAIEGLLDSGGIPQTARVVNLAGEILKKQLVDRIFALGLVEQVCNLYGPSETTTYSTWISMRREDGFVASIGRPIANTQIYILDGRRQIVPIGVAGEIYIGGAGVARGYLNRPELTAERFVKDPFSSDPQARMYKTGDLGRWRADGTIEYLGRNDHQVKIRGFRIELGEIEAQLVRHPQVQEAVVIAREDVPGEKRLVAYVVAESSRAAPGVEVLRTHLKAALPEHMVPSAFVVLESLPLTSSWKLDRRALPAPEQGAYVSRQYEAPQGEVEEILARIWGELLRVEQISRRDNFFDLGGHSLLATRVLSRIREQLNADLPLAALFEAATLEQLSTRVAGLTYQKDNAPPLVPQIRERMIPLSFAQERLWLLDRMGLVGTAYNFPLAIRLLGQLDEGALQRSFSELIRRHESLRTYFGEKDGVPHQLIEPPGPFELLREDLGDVVDSGQRELEIRHRIRRERLHRFNLSKGPLFRVVLVRMTSREHALLLTMHHIVSDGWSLGVLMDELSALYGAYASGHASPLSELPLQYADFAIWQRQWLQDTLLQEQLQYWRKRLLGTPPQLELPTDRPRPAIESFKGAALTFEVPAKLSDTLKQLGRKEGATLFMVLLAAYQLLLSRWSGQHDIVVGSPIAGRRNRQVEGLIGFFVNTLVLRTDISEPLNFREFLQRVKEMTLGAYAHQDLPFEALVADLRPERNLTRQPIFQVMITFENFPEPRRELPGLTWTWTAAETATTHFDLTLYLSESSGGLLGTFEYATDLFDAATIERMASNFRTLLDGIVADPDCTMRDLPLLSETEKEQMLIGFNATKTAYPQDRLVHELFEEQAARSMDAIAVVYEDRQLTYGELNRRANQLARYLRARGVGANQLVALCVERSLDMVVGLLGVLKAGGAYVPLDPSYPSERLAYMLKDASPVVLVTQAQLRDHLPATTAQVIELDEHWSAIDQQEDSNLCDGGRQWRTLGVGPHCLAYVIYTSGSTGTPKGVMIEHAGVVNLLSAMQLQPGINSNDCMLAVTTLSFDIAALEIYLPLLNGAKLIVASRETASDAARLIATLERYGVTVLQATPATWRMLLGAGWTGRSTLKALCGGEALTRELSRQVKSRVMALWNLYGPTETTIWSCSRQIATEDEHHPIASIGRPIANTQVYILDEHRRPVPLGVVGEIYIGGVGVSRGYLNRPKLTAERFVRDQFSVDPLARLYKTGDLGRWRPDGTLEYRGRNDYQVKIRGYRIELGEIEALLTRYEHVKEAVVVARDNVAGEKGLVAYVVGDRHPTVDGDSPRVPQALRNEVVKRWETLWGETYAGQEQKGASAFAGWNSSYTGEPIPEGQMQEWLTCTVERIRGLRPKKILEIGCGAGLLLQYLAPSCAKYIGTDFSAAALEQLRCRMDGRKDLKHVELLNRPATDFEDLQIGSFDTVILNSVAQYFPDIQYLVSVLEGAVRLISPGGKFFIGDVRNLRLLSTFHTAVQLSKAGATVTAGQLRRRIARAMADEKELVIDPQFFQVLPGRLHGVSAANVHLKRGRSLNELTRYRYDVVLDIGERIVAQPLCESLGWPTAVASTVSLEVALRDRRWEAIRITSIPNSRLAKETAAQRLIETCDERLEAGALRRQLNELQLDAVDPNSIWQLGEAHGYDVAITCGTQQSPASMEIQFLDRAGVNQQASAVPQPSHVKPWRVYANDPLDNISRRLLILQAREYLSERIPPYMIPSAWVVMKQLPLTPNGKVDRNALPPPQGRSEESGEYIPAQSEVECMLANIWAQLLQVDQVGTRDNFFELGGHSMHAMRLIAAISDRCNVRVPAIVVFQHPTIQQMSKVVESLRSAEGMSMTECVEFDEGVI